MYSAMSASRNLFLNLVTAVVVVGLGTAHTSAVPTALAQASVIPGITVMAIVKWSGTDCIPARTADENRDLCKTVGQPRSEALVEHGHAVGDLVGVDPVMGQADWVSCELYLNGSPTMSDAALAGDGSDVTCLTVLR
jgi:hypothetical protein